MPSGRERGENGNARVWVSIGEKVRLGKYETLDVDIGAAVDVPEGQTEAEALRDLGRKVRAEHQVLLDVLREDKGV